MISKEPAFNKIYFYDSFSFSLSNYYLILNKDAVISIGMGVSEECFKIYGSSVVSLISSYAYFRIILFTQL